MIRAERYHDISCGHRVYGHESKCAFLHGHNYRIYFTVEAEKLDSVGRVLDFSVIKQKLCMWLEENWDHKFLAWEQDDLMQHIWVMVSDFGLNSFKSGKMFSDSIVWTPFNPTAENMAQYLVDVVGPRQLSGTGCRLVKCSVEETRKCSAEYQLDAVPNTTFPAVSKLSSTHKGAW